MNHQQKLTLNITAQQVGINMFSAYYTFFPAALRLIKPLLGKVWAELLCQNWAKLHLAFGQYVDLIAAPLPWEMRIPQSRIKLHDDSADVNC